MKSDNPCPSCGGHEWDVYLIDADTKRVRRYSYCTPLVDVEWKWIQFILGFDECRKCGVVVS